VRKPLDWKRSRVSRFEVEAVPHSYIPYVQTGLRIALYVRMLLLVKSFDLRPSFPVASVL
jgi:hypothetical protein